MVGQVEKEKQNDGIRRWKFQSLKTIGKFLTLKMNYIIAKFITENNWADMYNRMSTRKPKLFGIQIWWYQNFLLT